MSNRITAERLAELNNILDNNYYLRAHPKPWLENVLREALAEIREVTREREEARKQRDFMEAQFSGKALRNGENVIARDKASEQAGVWLGATADARLELNTLREERDKLKQGLADLNAKAGNEYAIVAHYKGEMVRLATENADMKASSLNLIREYDHLHVGLAEQREENERLWTSREEWCRKAALLEAELAKYKAVADAAMGIDWMDNAHDASIYIVTCKSADRLLSALAALDPKEGG